MRKSTFLLLILVFASFNTSNELITISGKITNTDNGKITIKGESFNKVIKLNADGTFAENITIDYDGIYSLETGKNSIPIYLSKGTEISVSADDNMFISTLKYSGKGGVENQYLVNKSLITGQISHEDLYKLDETEFLNKLTEIKNSVTALYNKTKFSDTYYKEKEAKNIHYLEQKHLLFYKNYHNFHAHLNGFKVSDEFPKLDTKMDLDNDADFLFSIEYRPLAMLSLFETIKDNATNIDFNIAKINAIKTGKSQNLKNLIIQYSIYDISIDNPNYEKIYQEYLLGTNNKKLKENLTTIYNNIKAVEIGKPSPQFDYENHKGGKTSLESLKGKYVYIDVWATWCGPCIKEIPSLQKVEEQYKDKNIAFVSMSVDTEKDHDKWRTFVAEKKLGGIQLLADKEFNSAFIQAYGIMAIPRFILIDPNGTIVNSQAPRPSETALIDLFNELKI
jgi:thiol-disulfide isomerase/thioredoxin